MSREHALTQLGQKGILMRHGKCLIIEDAAQPGRWDLPGGRVEVNERLDDAFRREIKEELGFDKFIALGIVDYAMISRKENPSICLVAQLIKNDSDPIMLSPEHSAYRWISLEELHAYQFCWDAMKQMVQKGFEYSKLLSNAG